MSPLLLLLLACAETPCAGPLCDDPIDGGGGDGGTSAGDGGSGAPSWTTGDPITTLGADKGGFYEFVDAEVLDEDWALLVGQGGYAIASLADGSFLSQNEADRGYSIGFDDGRAWVGTRYYRLYELDLADPTAPTEGRTLDLLGITYSDVDFKDGIIAIAGLEDGLILFDDGDLGELGRLDLPGARGVALLEGRALVSYDADDGPALALVDLADPSNPTVRAEAALLGTGHDITWEGETAAVAEGGMGVGVFTVGESSLESRAQLDLPGTSMGVDIDGDHLWIGAWEVAAVAWVGAGDPVVLGHEAPTESAMGIGAGHGKAMIADWFHSTALQLEPGLAGAELVLASTLWMEQGSVESYRLPVFNGGALDLELSFTDTTGFSVNQPDLVLAPGERVNLLVQAKGGATTSTLGWTSNDPDEGSGSLVIDTAQTGVGSAHPDFSLQSFAWPDTTLSTSRLSDFEGEVVFLAWWAEY